MFTPRSSACACAGANLRIGDRPHFSILEENFILYHFFAINFYIQMHILAQLKQYDKKNRDRRVKPCLDLKLLDIKSGWIYAYFSAFISLRQLIMRL